MTAQAWLNLVVFPIVVAVVVWAITGRRKDQAAIRQLLAEARKAAAEGHVAEATVGAAIELADVNTLQAYVKAMSEAFQRERESLTLQLEKAVHTADTCLARQTALGGEVDDLRGDIERYHREVLDMYRRDQYHAHALKILTDWIADNLPLLAERYPDLPPPPHIEPLPPLLIQATEDIPARRWYDDAAADDPPMTPGA